MSIDIRHIQAFITVANELHFGRAAMRLNIAQPALSRTVQHLELLLGVQLLARTTRNVQLTEAGRTFQEQGSRVLHQLNQAIHLTRRTPRGEAGTISVGYVDVLLGGPIPEIMQRFRSAFHDVFIEFVPHSPESLVGLVSEKQLDCGFSLGPPGNSSLDAHCIAIEPFVVLLPVSHRLGIKSSVRFQDLARETFVMPPRFGWQRLHERVETLCLEAGFNPIFGQEAQQIEAVMALIAAESGIGFCPETLCSALRSGVIAKPIADKNMSLETYFITHKSTSNALLANFANIVADYAVNDA